MSYIGNQPPDIGAYDVESFDGGGTSFTLKRAATVSSVLLFIDGVRQTPTDAYTVSGTALTTTATTPSGTDNVTVMFMGDVVDIGAPSSDTITSAMIVDGSVANADMADMAANTIKVRDANSSGVPSDKALATTEVLIGDGTGFTAAALSGDVTMTNAGAVTIATDAVDIAMLSATGTADATTFLRGDNAWAEAGGGKVLQVVHVTDAGPGTQTTSASWVNTDTTASITCSATTSKVLVMFGGSCTGYRASDANQYTGKYRLYETATTTAYPSGLYFARGTVNAVSSDSGNRFGTYVGGAWLHSPSSTSALTYTVQITKNNDSTFWNETSDETATMTLMEIGA